MLIIDALQNDIPLVSKPFAEIAESIGIPEENLLDRLTRLHERGIVRGISPTLEPQSMGLSAATLIALHISAERVHEVAAIISSYPEVSHNFRRDHHYSLWFTLCGKEEESISRVLSEILHRTGIPDADVLNLPTVNKIKVDVRFSLFKDKGGESTYGPT